MSRNSELDAHIAMLSRAQRRAIARDPQYRALLKLRKARDTLDAMARPGRLSIAPDGRIVRARDIEPHEPPAFVAQALFAVAIALQVVLPLAILAL